MTSLAGTDGRGPVHPPRFAGGIDASTPVAASPVAGVAEVLGVADVMSAAGTVGVADVMGVAGTVGVADVMGAASVAGPIWMTGVAGMPDAPLAQQAGASNSGRLVTAFIYLTCV